jgi:RNA recognition motif-containing protein
MNIFVAKLSGTTTGDDLLELFREYGEVISAKVIFDRETGNSKRFGFVEMANDDEAQNAINELNEKDFKNSNIVVKKASPKPEAPQKRNFNRGGNRNRF